MSKVSAYTQLVLTSMGLTKQLNDNGITPRLSYLHRSRIIQADITNNVELTIQLASNETDDLIVRVIVPAISYDKNTDPATVESLIQTLIQALKKE